MRQNSQVAGGRVLAPPRCAARSPGFSSDTVTDETKHISVCVCTYRRTQFLKRLLKELGGQDTGGLFTYSIVVADNDYLESAKAVVSDFAAQSAISVTYCVEPRQNIALARNKAIENANGDFVAFIDDDEFPIQCWLLTLFRSCNEYGVDGVLGPVKPYFDEEPPKWVVKGRFYERHTYPTGFVIDWRKGRTGNVLLRKQIFAGREQPFRPDFRAGEDQDFFHRVIKEGHVFIWCDEAVAYEVVPSMRWKRTFMLKRALLRGSIEPKTPAFGARDIAKSLIAVLAYTAALPFGLIVGHDKFMALLVRLCDHLGKLLASVGIDPIRKPYITD